MSQHPRSSEVIYQVYPASFNDSNGDGWGDLNGITKRLDYIAALHVDAVWISPFFLSPAGYDGDGGYAITDYRAIDPQYGTMQDFQRLLQTAHELGLRIYTDFVVPHTADDHEWFIKSRAKVKDYDDFYTWRDGKKAKDGSLLPPNNWKSVFGGDAWTFDKARGQYYLHHFLKSQPALNHNNPAVRAAVIGEMKFWLDMGVDGFRIDALPFATHDPECRDNPWLKDRDPNAGGWRDQYFEYSICQPGTLKLVTDIRHLCNRYERNVTTLGEVICGRQGGRDAVPVAASYVDFKTGLSMCYTDALVRYTAYPDAAEWARMINDIEHHFPTGGNCNATCNHDKPRVASSMTTNIKPDYHQAVIRQMVRIVAVLPGSYCMYQGEELGLPQMPIQDIPVKQLKDPRAFTQSLLASRDGARTPMPWRHDLPNADFSSAAKQDIYLPLPDTHLSLAVDLQEQGPDSMLTLTRRILKWRKAQPALQNGATHAAVVIPHIFKIERHNENQHLIHWFNTCDKPQSLDHHGQKVTIAPYGFYCEGDLNV